jgi:hypothetical protein
MRCEGADALDVDAGDDAALRHDNLDLRTALEPVAVGEGEIVPADEDRRLAAASESDRPMTGTKLPALSSADMNLRP